VFGLHLPCVFCLPFFFCWAPNWGVFPFPNTNQTKPFFSFCQGLVFPPEISAGKYPFFPSFPPRHSPELVGPFFPLESPGHNFSPFPHVFHCVLHGWPVARLPLFPRLRCGNVEFPPYEIWDEFPSPLFFFSPEFLFLFTKNFHISILSFPFSFLSCVDEIQGMLF